MEKCRNAINIPLATLSKEQITNLSAKTTIVIYDLIMGEELVAFAKRLEEYGITDFYLLAGGIFQVNTEIYDLQKTGLKSLLDND